MLQLHQKDLKSAILHLVSKHNVENLQKNYIKNNFKNFKKYDWITQRNYQKSAALLEAT